MPNHVTNIITINGNVHSVQRVFDAIRGENGAIDFNSIICQPETFKKYDTTNHPNGKGLVIGEPVNPFEDDNRLVTEDLIDEFKKATKFQLTFYGVVGWYDWNRKNWGTKWNAYSIEKSNNVITFDTAWSAPLPIYAKLAKMFPNVEMEIIFADEDAGNNTGRISISDGKMDEYFPEYNSDEAWELYFATHPGMDDYYKKNESGQYVYSEDE